MNFVNTTFRTNNPLSKLRNIAMLSNYCKVLLTIKVSCFLLWVSCVAVEINKHKKLLTLLREPFFKFSTDK